MRIFIAIDIPDRIKKEITKIQEQLPYFKGKKTEFYNLHLTLKFLGEIDDKTFLEVKKRLKQVKLNSFESEIDSIGIFSDRIIWMGIKNCEKLQKEIDEKLKGLFEEEKRFMGHLTIARIRNMEDKKKFLSELKKIKVFPMKFAVKEFILKESILTKQKPIYENLENYELGI